MPVRLTGPQLARLQELLIVAFPTESDLAQMVRFGMDRTLDSVAGTGPLDDVVFRLLEWAESRGLLGALIAAAAKANPTNSELGDFAREVSAQTAATDTVTPASVPTKTLTASGNNPDIRAILATLPAWALPAGVAVVAVAIIAVLALSGQHAQQSPTPTATPRIVIIATATFAPPTATSTPAPTPTPILPTSTPVSSPTATPLLAPGPGLSRPDAIFNPVWQRQDVQTLLGWARQAQAQDAAVAVQLFQHGRMIWRGDTTEIVVVYDNGGWIVYPDTWTEDQIVQDPSISPPSGFVQPKRGFGKVWRTQPGVRDSLGWAMRDEWGYTAKLQDFERGTMIRTDAETYAFGRQANTSLWYVF